MDLAPLAEGTTSYNASWRDGDGSGKYYPKGWKRPTELTIDEAIRMAPDMKRSAGNFTLGKYQFKAGALGDAKTRMNLSGDELLSESMQDRIMRERLAYRGYDRFLAGALPIETFQKKLAKEWPSMGGAVGVKQYDGVRVRDPRTPAEVVRATLEKARADADVITNRYLEDGRLPPERGRWREPSKASSPKAPARR